jgi:hypothetical protein
MADQTDIESVLARKRHPGGRPRWIPTPEQVRQMENLSADGLSFREIAVALRSNIDTLLEKAQAVFRVFPVPSREGGRRPTPWPAGSS